LFPAAPALVSAGGQHRRVFQVPLACAGLTAQAEYFRKHTRRMQCQEFYEQYYPLGSGTLE